jgi:hypothetical protein
MKVLSKNKPALEGFRLLALIFAVRGRRKYILVGLTPASMPVAPLPAKTSAKIHVYRLFSFCRAMTFGMINNLHHMPNNWVYSEL